MKTSDSNYERRSAVALAIGLLGSLALAGCSQQTAATTASMAPVPPPNTTSSRLERLAWNSAWAQNCGFYFDNQKLKSAFLAFEANSGIAPDQLTKLGRTYDRAQTTIRAIAASHPDECTDQRLEKIRATMARYLAGDFTPGEAV